MDIIVPPLQSDFTYGKEPGLPYAPTTPDWTLDSFEDTTFYSPNISGAQLLGNGNILVTEGTEGRTFEVDTILKAPKWKYVNPINTQGPITQGQNPGVNVLFRMNRYADHHPAFVGKDLTPMGPIELNPIITPCDIIAGNEEFSASESFSAYPNPTTGLVNFQGTENIEKFALFNHYGELLTRSQTLISNQLDLSHLPNGIYFIQVNTGETQRIVLLR